MIGAGILARAAHWRTGSWLSFPAVFDTRASRLAKQPSIPVVWEPSIEGLAGITCRWPAPPRARRFAPRLEADSPSESGPGLRSLVRFKAAALVGPIAKRPLLRLAAAAQRDRGLPGGDLKGIAFRVGQRKRSLDEKRTTGTHANVDIGHEKLRKRWGEKKKTSGPPHDHAGESQAVYLNRARNPSWDQGFAAST